MPTAAAVPRRAASLVVLRDAPEGLQVLLLRRADKPGDQNSGATVFPGGLLDEADRGHYERCHGLDDRAASTRLALPSDGLHYYVAAVRECFEEAGLLIGVDAAGQPIDLGRIPEAELWELRKALHANRIGMAEVCERIGARLAVDRLAYLSHWITPLGMPKIFDTRFFVTRMPEGQRALHDSVEAVDLLWLTPAQALDPARGLKLLNVTELTLRRVAAFDDAQSVIDAAHATAIVPMTRPRVGKDGSGARSVVNPGESAYAELGRLDPHGHGKACAELVPGRGVWLSPRVLRVTAPNGSLMTGPGTNSYFIGVPGSDDWALLDAGPDDASHVQALLDAAPGRITRLLVTHTHKDHSPAVAALRQATGATTYGRVADHAEWQDTGFTPDHRLSDGDRIALGTGVTLRVIHTPGHASNHLCYLLEEERLLFTGDHLMQGSTVVINPPDGDMAVYLASLERLLAEDLEWLAPGHGFLIDEPHAVVRKTIAHRLAREAMVLADVRAHGPAHEEAIVGRVYAGTDRRLHAVALRSLRAHLQKLRNDGALLQQDDGSWQERASGGTAGHPPK